MVEGIIKKEVNSYDGNIYFKEWFEHLERKLEIAKEISSKDDEIAFLICIVNIEGMAGAWENKSNLNLQKGERFTQFLEKFCKISYINTQEKRKNLWSIFRCSLAHSGMIGSLFIDKKKNKEPINMKFHGSIEKVDGQIEFRELNGLYYQISLNHLFEIYEDCLNNLRNYIKSLSENFGEEFFSLPTLKCERCNYCYPKATPRCPSCNTKNE